MASKDKDRHYLFTIQNPVEDPDFDLLNQFTNLSLRYAVWQLEQAPSTGTVHFQCYVEFSRPQRLSVIERWGALHPEAIPSQFFSLDCERFSWCQGIHVEQRVGSREACKQYCSEPTFKGKDKGFLSGPWEWGIFSGGGQGRRTDLAGAAAWLAKGGDLRGLAERWPDVYVKYSGGLEKLSNLSAPREFREVRSFVLWGATGVGKSKFVYSAFGFNNVHVVASTSPFWLGPYCGQPVLFFEEFDSSLDFKTLLRVLDGYPDFFPVKGGHAAARWFRVILTCNSDFTVNWPPELKRRIGCSDARPHGNVFHCGPDGRGFPSIEELGGSGPFEYEPVRWGVRQPALLADAGGAGRSPLRDDGGAGAGGGGGAAGDGLRPSSSVVSILPSYSIVDGVVRECSLCGNSGCETCFRN